MGFFERIEPIRRQQTLDLLGVQPGEGYGDAGYSTAFDDDLVFKNWHWLENEAYAEEDMPEAQTKQEAETGLAISTEPSG